MTRAEEAALKAYPTPPSYVSNSPFGPFIPPPEDPQYQREIFVQGYEQAEKDLINRIRQQVQMWMPEKDGEEYTDGKRLAFRSVLQLLKGLEDEK